MTRLSTDVRFEADFLRAALLVGLVRETDVHAWAESLLEAAAADDGRLTDVVLAPPELTALREALRPIAEPATPYEVGVAVLAFMVTDPSAATLSVIDQLRVLTLLRRERMVSSDAASAIKLFEDRNMLASAGVAGMAAPSSEEIRAWLSEASATSTHHTSSMRHS